MREPTLTITEVGSAVSGPIYRAVLEGPTCRFGFRLTGKPTAREAAAGVLGDHQRMCGCRATAKLEERYGMETTP